jgi:hypothetical protein
VKAANDASRQMMKMLVTNTMGDDGKGEAKTKKLSEEAFLGWVHKGNCIHCYYSCDCCLFLFFLTSSFFPSSSFFPPFKGSQMPGHKRRQFAKGREDRRAMILLLRTVEIIARQENWTPRKLILHKLFQQYDQDGSGHIDSNELSSMMCAIVPSIDQKEANDCSMAVVKHLDSSGNDLLEEEEFFDWLNNGMKMNESDRIQLKRGGASKKNLVIFLEGIERLLLEKEQ